MSRLEFRESGIGWIGSVPAHWAVAPLYSRFNVELGKMLSPEAAAGPHQAPYLGNSNVQWRSVEVSDLKEMSFSPADRARFRLRDGDLLVCEGGEIGRTAIWRSEVEECYYQKAVHRLRPRHPEADPEFFFYLMVEASARGVFHAGGNVSTIIHLTSEKLRAHRFPFPPLAEQRVIASFLDRRTAAIDALIAKKERLIELIQERRKTLITEALTKGIDPNAPVRDSGIRSLGLVPAHWTVVRNKILFREVNERTGDGADDDLLTVSHLTGVTRRSDKQNVTMFMAESTEGYKKCSPGDLAINTMWAWMGALGISSCPGIVSPSYNVYRFRRDENLRYFDLLLRTPPYVSEIQSRSEGVWTSRLRLYPEAFLNMLTAVPPRDEQDEILKFVDESLEAEGRIEERLHAALALLREYRQALISAAVTGKIQIPAEEAA